MPRNPDFPENKDLWLYKAFAGMRDIKRKVVDTEANLTKQAEIQEDDWMDAMCQGSMCLLLAVSLSYS